MGKKTDELLYNILDVLKRQDEKYERLIRTIEKIEDICYKTVVDTKVNTTVATAVDTTMDTAVNTNVNTITDTNNAVDTASFTDIGTQIDSPNVRKINSPLSIFIREDMNANIKQRIETWIEDVELEQAQGTVFGKSIKSNVISSKINGTDRSENLITVTKKGISLWTDSEIDIEYKEYVERLYGQGFVKVIEDSKVQ